MASIYSTNAQISNYSALFDGGNTQSLLDKVNSSSYSLSQLKTDLLAASPYLTDTVLIATFKRSNPFTEGDLNDIIIPNSPLTAQAFKALDTAAIYLL